MRVQERPRPPIYTTAHALWQSEGSIGTLPQHLHASTIHFVNIDIVVAAVGPSRKGALCLSAVAGIPASGTVGAVGVSDLEDT